MKQTDIEITLGDGRIYICADNTSGVEYPAKDAMAAGMALEKYLADYCGMENKRKEGIPDREKVEILVYLLENAVRELQDREKALSTGRLFGLIGTNEEEMKKLGFHVIP